MNLPGYPCRLDGVDRGGAGRRLPAQGDARHLAHSQRRCRHHAAGRVEELSADAAAGDHEVVLTFDDGPWPPTTPRVLAALAHECVRATFFLIGKPASEHPDLVRRIAAEGHTIGTSHLAASQPDANQARARQPRKSTTAFPRSKWRFTGSRPPPRARRSFVFPAFETTPATLDLLQSRGIVVFGADLWASDWNPMTPKQELKLLIDRLKIARKGIILLHDPKAHTAAMLPAFLRYLKDNHYRVVHLVPAAPRVDSTASREPEIMCGSQTIKAAFMAPRVII
jgi:peptidoglycan/xylan/chitin deacetylase (PgdA/CDA1 family)